MIPDKLYYKIGEVAQIAGLEPYVLRYWESEFKEITPIKSKSNQRLYRKKDIDTVMLIKKLLYSEGFTIDGARKRIKELKADGDQDRSDSQNHSLEDAEEQMTLGFSGDESLEARENLVSLKSTPPKIDLKFLKNIKKELEEVFQMLQR